MNIKKFIPTWIFVFLVFLLLSFIFNVAIMGNEYKKHTELIRIEGTSFYIYSILSILIFTFFFCFIYTKGYEKGKPGVIQGFRYGLYIVGFICLSSLFGNLGSLTWPTNWIWISFATNSIILIISGLIAGATYNTES